MAESPDVEELKTLTAEINRLSNQLLAGLWGRHLSTPEITEIQVTLADWRSRRQAVMDRIVRRNTPPAD